jgi:uncharacterized membrane protein YjjP (DUF1212 family)
VKHRQKYIIELARAFLTYGAPTHRIEKQLKRSAVRLGIRSTEFLLLPNIIFISFHEEESSQVDSLHIIMQIGGIFLSQLHATHQLYEEVAGPEEEDVEDDDGVDYDYDYSSTSAQKHSRKRQQVKSRGAEPDTEDDSDGDAAPWVEGLVGPEQGWRRLNGIRNSQPPFTKWDQCFIAFLAGFTITVLAFDGSTADAACAGVCAWLLTCLALFASGSNPLIAKVFELLAAFLISAVSRGLYSHTHHKLCYSAISSGGIVLILPGFAVSEYILSPSANQGSLTSYSQCQQLWNSVTKPCSLVP